MSGGRTTPPVSEARAAETDAVTDADDGFLTRWSRRKAQAGASSRPEPPAGPPAAAELQSAGPAPGPSPTEAPAITDEDLPPVESLGDDSDYSAFLSPGVSEQLRQTALRRLFRASKFNVVDGLDDYAEDFREFEALGSVVTAELRHRMRVESERMKRDALEADGEAAHGRPAGSDQVASGAEPDAQTGDAVAGHDGQDSDERSDDPSA